MRSPTCCRQENAIFSPHFHRTWEAYFSPSLYLKCIETCFLFQLSGLCLIVTGGVIQGVYSQYLDFLGDKGRNSTETLLD